jgi:hypothetical protein
MDTDGRFPTPTTRRTIVATGAKLAYAAPLVATSLTLSALNVAASHITGHVFACPPIGPDDGPLCNPGADCFCTTAVPSGRLVCTTDDPRCSGPFCDDATGAGCPAGRVCVVDEFFEGRAHCHGLCGGACIPDFPGDSARAGAHAHS